VVSSGKGARGPRPKMALERHLDLTAAAAETCLSRGFLREQVRAGRIDPVVEVPGVTRATTRVLIPASSLARFLADFLVTRNPEVPGA